MFTWFKNQDGNVKGAILAIVGGVITLVVGLVLESTVITQATTAGTHASIGSFAGSKALNDLTPLAYNAAVVMIAVGLIGLGGAGLTGRGPLG